MTDNTTTETVDTAALRRKAYTNAETALKAKYNEEFRALVTAEATKLGVTYAFRKTKAERAAEQVQNLLNEFPELREQFASE